MTPGTFGAHASFHRVMRGAMLEQAVWMGERETGWEDVRESWMRLRPPDRFPASQLVFGRPSARTGLSTLESMPVPLANLGPFSEAATPRKKRQIAREFQRGAVRVWIDADHFYYALPRDAGFEPYQQLGALRWRYVGQRVFSERAQRARTGSWSAAGPRERVAPSDFDTRFGVGRASRVDALGRAWLLESVDATEMVRAREAYDAAAFAMFGVHESVEQTRPRVHINDDDGRWTEVEDGASAFAVPTLWTVTYCSGEGASVWDCSTDALSRVDTPLNDRQQKLVWFTASCSGTIVDSNWVLSAAHCLTDSSGSLDPLSSIEICSFGNLDGNASASYTPECMDAVDAVASPTWTGATSAPDDYAVAKFSSLPAVGYMALSQASDSKISGFKDFTRGYPRLVQHCDLNRETSDALTSDDGESGAYMYGAHGTIQDFGASHVNYDTSTALGMSGGAHFYCPNGSGCDDGHYLTGVQSTATTGVCIGSWCWGGYTSGPRARTIRDWVIANTP